MALKKNDLRNWQPRSPVLLCGGNSDLTDFFNLNTQLKQGFWSAPSPAALLTGLLTMVDVDSSPSGATDLFATVKVGFAQSKGQAAQAAVAAGAAGGGASAVVQNYHSSLLPPFCNAMVRGLLPGQNEFLTLIWRLAMLLRFPQPVMPRIAALALCLTALCSTAAVAQNGKTEVLWLGQAATRITTPTGKVIVIDPWLTSNPKTPAGFKDISALGKVDLILVTHAHFDHFADAPALAKMHNAPMYGPAGLNQTVAALGILPTELSPRFGKGGTITPFGPQGVKITAVHAEHSSELGYKNPATDKEEVHPGGEPVGFIVEMENGFKVWHMGDTAVFGDMRLIGEMYRPDLVMIPIGGHFVMNPKDAAMAVRDMIKPRFALPIHYGTTPQLRGTPAEIEASLGNAPGTAVMLKMDPGQKVDF